jgi:hypothetical protein
MTAMQWPVADLSLYWESEIPRPHPEVGQRADGLHLFYKKAVNALFGDSNSAKSYIALLFAKQEMERGNRVVYIDLESSGHSVVARLKAYGVDPAMGKDRFIYIKPVGPYRDAERLFLEAVVAEAEPSLVVIDTMGEGLAIQDANSYDEKDVTSWMQSVPAPIAAMGPAVLLVDHVGNSDEAKTRQVGSFRKRAAVSGAAYSADMTVPHAKGREGQTLLTCRKDREGWFANGQPVALFVMEDDENGRNAQVELRVPPARASGPKRTRVQECAEAIDGLELPEDVSEYKIRTALRDAGHTFGNETIKKALTQRSGLRLVSSLNDAGAA